MERLVVRLSTIDEVGVEIAHSRSQVGPRGCRHSCMAPPDDRESAILLPLGPGNYTTIVRGAGGTTGIAINEIFRLDN